METVDAIVIGAGPNGLVAANMLADAGWDVLVLEEQHEPGGAVRTGELTRPGFRHDLFAGFFPLGPLSPALRRLGLEDHGLEWRRAPAALAHPTPDGDCALIGGEAGEAGGSLDAYSAGDGAAWQRLFEPYRRYGPQLLDVMLGPLGSPATVCRLARRFRKGDPGELARLALVPVRHLADDTFRGEGGRLLLAGNALQTDVSPDGAGSGLLGWVVSAVTEASGNPAPAGGAAGLIDALVARLRAAGGELRCAERVERVVLEGGRASGIRLAGGEVVRARRAVLADTSAPALYLELLAAVELPARVRHGMARFCWDPATVKVDWALAQPMPWSAAGARRAACVNIADDLDELSTWASEMARGVLSARPFLLVGQHANSDPTRQPAEGGETLSAYARVPRVIRRDALGEVSGRWDADEEEAMVERIEVRLDERAPGWRSLVVGRHVLTPPRFSLFNANLDQGSVNGGTSQLHQQFVFRPVPGTFGARTFVRGLYLASSAAHPGGGVHGACGFNAARAALASARPRFGRFGASSRLASNS